VWHLSLELVNSFNKTKAAIFPTQAMLPKVFPFLSDLCSILQLHVLLFLLMKGKEGRCNDDKAMPFFDL